MRWLFHLLIVTLIPKELAERRAWAIGVLLCGVITITASAADTRALEAIFKANFKSAYEARQCGRNIARLLGLATDRDVDLSDTHVLKIKGAGFFETSGFYTRTAPDERAMLGYFHFVLINNGRVFDFDLHEPLVLDLERYVRLQFSPPENPVKIYGVLYDAREQLNAWTVTRFEVADFQRSSSPRATWTKSLGDLVNLDRVFSRRRVR